MLAPARKLGVAGFFAGFAVVGACAGVCGVGTVGAGGAPPPVLAAEEAAAPPAAPRAIADNVIGSI